jgi:hypothetical protein
VCGEEKKYEEKKNKELNYFMQSMISWQLAMTIIR